MTKLFGPSLCLTLWGIGLPFWQAALVPAGALGILALVRAHARQE